MIGVEIDERQQHRAALPPAGIIVMRRNLVESEPLVVIGTDPFGRIDGAFFQCGIDIAAAELLQDASGKTADAEFQTLEVVGSGELLAKPTTHLTSSVAGKQRNHIILL